MEWTNQSTCIHFMNPYLLNVQPTTRNLLASTKYVIYYDSYIDTNLANHHPSTYISFVDIL
jgi:hypothetical protein